MTFTDFIGHEDAKLALMLNAIDPRCGGVLFAGEKGSGKSTLSRLFKNLLPEKTPFINLPLNITEDVLLGGIHIEETLKTGKRVFQKGILSRAHEGIIYIDDINLLSSGMASFVLEAQYRGENIVEREGLALRHSSRFIPVASMNPEEGALSPHLLDRFGMCVLWEGLKEKAQKIEIMKTAMRQNVDSGLRDRGFDGRLMDKVIASRLVLKDVIVSPEIEDVIAQSCIGNHISGHRGDLFLFYAVRAYAAYCDEKMVTRSHVDAVMPLVLLHRKRLLQQMEKENQEEKPQKEMQDEQHNKEPDGEKDKKSGPEKSDSQTNDPDSNDGKEASESNPREEIFEPGALFKSRRFVFRKDRLFRFASGRRTSTRSKDKGGRYVKSRLNGQDDIAIDATLRAAAPFQRTRGRKEMVLIEKEDFRFKQRERKMKHLAIFVVDGSGSMGAKRRMVETKGAIQSLLMDCYQKRDRVSLIVFRKDRAETVLPPTSSVERAAKCLRDIPVGGKTPLSAGLLEAYKLIQRVGAKSPETRFLLLLVTDGRANQGLTEAPLNEEVQKATQLFQELRYTDYIVVDTENKNSFIKTDSAIQLAMQLNADYHTIENLKTEYLTALVQKKKEAAFGRPMA